MTVEDTMPTQDISGIASGLASVRSTQRLNLIDKVRANGIGDQVSLPQLAIFGDQGAGKSSVLERVTGIPFPRQEGLCTRFPTEIILRNSTQPMRISASIHHTDCASATLMSIVAKRRYHRQLSDISDLPTVINEVAGLVGIRGFGSNKTGSAFSHVTLRVEIVGPVGLHLSIVDLPGLISVASDEQEEGDVCMVNDIAEEYLASTRTIIIAVIQAGNDIANQRIVQLARKHDPHGERTVGVITKPDLINRGTEARIAMLAKNMDSVKLELGFFLMKNPSPSEIEEGLSQESLTSQESDFFRKPAWQKLGLDMSRVGAHALGTFVSELLDRHIQKELPKVRDEIKLHLADREAELSSMGIQRSTVADVRCYLTNLSMRFHGLANAALNGVYQDPESDFFQMAGTRLRAEIHKLNSEFSKRMHDSGQKRKVSDCSSKLSADRPPTTGSNVPQLLVSEEQMTDWVKDVYINTRGRELPGNNNYVLAEELFHEQSSPWPYIATSHVGTIVKMVLDWVGAAIRITTQEETVTLELCNICCRGVEEARVLAKEELYRLIAEEQGPLITYNHYYTDNIQKARHDKQLAAIREAIPREKSGWVDGTYVHQQPIDTDKVARSLQKQIVLDMNRQACSEALEGLSAYYKVALKTFIDNVCRQVVERHILSKLPQLFSPNTVSGLSDDELLRIGSEPESQRCRRKELQAKVKGLQQSLLDLETASL